MNLSRTIINKLNESEIISNPITLYHNTSNDNAVKINKEGIKGGMRLSAYGKGSEAEGAGIWCTTQRGYGYGGATITFQVNSNDEALRKQNDTEFILYRDVTPEEIIDIDLVVSNIPCVQHSDKYSTTTVESDIPQGIKNWGKESLLKVYRENQHSFIEPYSYEQLVNLIETCNKYCKGTITLTESTLLEKASIDWNNYLTKDEVNKFLSKDDKVESAEEIVYNTDGNFYNKYFNDFKNQGWTKDELTQDLANFYYNGNLNEDAKDLWKSQINQKSEKELQEYLSRLYKQLKQYNQKDSGLKSRKFDELLNKINYIEDKIGVKTKIGRILH